MVSPSVKISLFHSIAVPARKMMPSVMVSAHHAPKTRMRPRSMASSASQMVRLLESRQTVLKMGTSRICGVGP